jgi:hypothetical protein
MDFTTPYTHLMGMIYFIYKTMCIFFCHVPLLLLTGFGKWVHAEEVGRLPIYLRDLGQDKIGLLEIWNGAKQKTKTSF